MKTKHTLDGIQFDSQEELYFYLWLLEAKEAGFVRDFIYHPEPFVITPEVSAAKLIEGSIKMYTLLRGHKYQADFIVFPGDRQLKGGLGFTKRQDNEGYYIDVKGTFNQNDALRRFSIDQKLVYNKYGVYVNKVIINDIKVKKDGKSVIKTPGLFRRTWVPVGCAFKGKGLRREAFKECKLLREII